MSYYQITLLVTEEQENAIVCLFAARRWVYLKTGHGNDTTPIDSIESGNRTLQAQEKFENMSQEQINESLFDILHSDIKPDDIAYGHSSTKRRLSGDNASDGPAINRESPTRSFFQHSIKAAEKRRRHQTSKIIKSIHTKKTLDIKSHTNARSYCNNKIMNSSKMDQIESCKQQESEEMESCIKEEPKETESCKQQEPIEIESCKQQEPKETESCKQQEHKETESYKQQEPKEIESCKQQEPKETGSCKQQDTRSEISSYEKMHSREERFKPYMPSVLRTIIDENFSQGIYAEETNVPERNDSIDTSGPKRKDRVKIIAEMKTCSKAEMSDKVSNLVNIYCKDCEHTFKGQKRFANHLKYDRCRHECEFCGKIFLHRTTYSYKMHVKYHKKQRDQECEICGKFFIGRSQMLSHVKLHAVPKPIVCEICGQGCQSRNALKVHKDTMHNDKREKRLCPKCPKMFMSPAGLAYHLQTRHDEDNNFIFPCNICNKVCKDKKLLKAHMVTHKETRNFKCDTCIAAFKSASSLYQHKQRHEKAFVRFCQYCQKGFYDSKALREHENIHTGARPYLCTFCDYTCANQANLGKHEKLVHQK